MTKSTIYTAQAALSVAHRQLRDAHSARDEELRASRDAITAKWASVIDPIQSAVYNAKQALHDAETAAVQDHEWEGQYVTREENQYSRYSLKITGIKTVRGFVRTYRPGVKLPQNRNNYVKIGDVLVFALKKDGTPGKDYEFFQRHEADWKLEVQS
jgi:hypothetical protein